MAPPAKSRVLDRRSVLMFVVLGLIGLVLDLRWSLNPNMMMVDGAIVSGLGLASIFKQKFAKLRRGNTPLSDPTQPSASATSDFRAGLFLVMLGSALLLLGKSTVDNFFH